MAALAQLRYSPLPNPHKHKPTTPRFISNHPTTSLPNPTAPSPPTLSLARVSNPNLEIKLPLDSTTGGGGGNPIGGNGGGGGGQAGGGGDSFGEEDGKFDDNSSGILGVLLSGWRSRVAADPQFAFKVLMEELVGVTACILGDMVSRPNFGLNELDFVFSTLVVGSIMNFALMYMLAPTIGSSSPNLPSIFASCPAGHMFEPGAYGVFDRFGTFVYKGLLFGCVGFGAGLTGTAISNGLIKLRKKMDPNFETPNKAPPTMLNALTWSLHMGLSSNLRYQTLNGIEYVLAKGVSPKVFQASVLIMRTLNNVLGGLSFVTLARLTGSQKAAGSGKTAEEEKEKLEEKWE